MKNLIDQFDVSKDDIATFIGNALRNADDGELFLEHRQSEALMFDNGRLKTASYNEDRGFGLRAVASEAVGYAHSGEMSLAALKRAGDAVSAVQSGYSGKYAAAPSGTNLKLYGDENPLDGPGFEEKVKLLQEIDAYLRAKDPKVEQVTVSLSANYQQVEILRANGHFVRDVRPLVRLNVSVVTGDGTKQETGSYGCGGRAGFGEFITTESWRFAAFLGLAGRHAARGGRPRARRRFQSKENLGFCRTYGRNGCLKGSNSGG
jgi:TldD protein